MKRMRLETKISKQLRGFLIFITILRTILKVLMFMDSNYNYMLKVIYFIHNQSLNTKEIHLLIYYS